MDRPGANGCVRIDGPISRSVCKQVDTLRAEKVASAKRTAELEATVANVNTIISSRTNTVASAADASADVLSKVLGKFGFDVAPADVG